MQVIFFFPRFWLFLLILFSLKICIPLSPPVIPSPEKQMPKSLLPNKRRWAKASLLKRPPQVRPLCQCSPQLSVPPQSLYALLVFQPFIYKHSLHVCPWTPLNWGFSEDLMGISNCLLDIKMLKQYIPSQPHPQRACQLMAFLWLRFWKHSHRGSCGCYSLGGKKVSACTHRVPNKGSWSVGHLPLWFGRLSHLPS